MVEEGYSVLMSVYKNEKPLYLKESIDSMLNQTVKPSEFILVSDGPLTTELDKIILEYEKMKLIKVIRLPENVGLGKALNKGVQHCTKMYIARMDSDDLSAPNRCEKQLVFMKKHPEVGIVGTDMIEMSNDRETYKHYPETHEEILKYSKSRNPFCHPSVFIRKKIFLESSGYQHMLYFEDYFLWYRLLNSGILSSNISEPLLRMRVDEGLYSRRGGIKYVKAVVSFYLAIYKRRYISLIPMLFYITLKSAVALLPVSFREAFYKKVLREKR